jgi:hypothetical protein
MSDHLALLVGRVILAWGHLDQQLHVALRHLSGSLNEPYQPDGRFNERRKMFRRLCVRMANGDSAYTSKLDRFCGDLQKLERARGHIAHGLAVHEERGAHFHDLPSTLLDEESRPETFISHEGLGEIETDIQKAAIKLINLTFDAVRAA